jgi:hypothetical protein
VRPLWKSEDELETRLRVSRRKPPAEYVSSIVNRLDEPRRAPRRRITLAVALTAAAVSVFGAFGGLSYAARAVRIAPVLSNPSPEKKVFPEKALVQQAAKKETQAAVQATQAAVTGTQSQIQASVKTNGKRAASSSIFSSLAKSPAADQYGGKTTICHRTGSKKNPFVVITVSNNALPAHKSHGDTLVNPNSPPACPGPPIP